ncbi:sensor histidine kinase [Phycisphaerales bacterium AB-hyl4]|uniref:histidine kinase n=1 Tax=Natronomicrosphaera hydrolytica TaxID=3242702 RepID=A0ABV4U038_9BACT
MRTQVVASTFGKGEVQLRRARFQSLGIAAIAGTAVALSLVIARSLSLEINQSWVTTMFGAAAVSMLVGFTHYGWTRTDRHNWTKLHDRQDRLNVCQRELAYKVRLLEIERQRLETIFNALGDAVLVTSADDTLELVNEAAGRLLRLPDGDTLPTPLEKVVNDPRLLQLIRETREDTNGSSYRHLEHRINEGGESMVFDLTLAGLELPGDQPTESDRRPGGVVAILRDVTQQRCVAEMHSDFVSGVSHELRTPLSSIKAYIEMLVDGEAQDEPTRQEFYAIIQAETNRLTRLIDNVLNISQIESGLANVQSTLVDVRDLVDQAMKLVRTQAEKANVQLQAPDVGEPCNVIADADMLLQVMLNLLGNAVKYTPKDGRVSVALRVNPKVGVVEVSVSDTGMGIPEADLPFIFDKFYRVASHRQLIKGTGLGLNLVKHVIETVHGGKIYVASRPGSGSTFTFRLSLADKETGGDRASRLVDGVCPLPATGDVVPCLSGDAARKDEK